jgi:hypothetical protein
VNPVVVTIIAVAILALVIAWDIWLATDDVSGNTISHQLRKLGKGVRLIAATSVGVLLGHLWWT